MQGHPGPDGREFNWQELLECRNPDTFSMQIQPLQRDISKTMEVA